MQPLYLVRIGDLGRGDLVQVDSAACHLLALLTPDFLPRLGLSRQAKVLDLKSQVPRMRSEGAGRRFGQVGASGRVSPAYPGISERAAPVCAYFARRKSATKP
jgi:hypothetical protein